ncbi:hypothetical protein BaRGS_00015993, partial [Batillaria attramentaria]
THLRNLSRLTREPTFKPFPRVLADECAKDHKGAPFQQTMAGSCQFEVPFLRDESPSSDSLLPLCQPSS